jgi:hypothetical protein
MAKINTVPLVLSTSSRSQVHAQWHGFAFDGTAIRGYQGADYPWGGQLPAALAWKLVAGTGDATIEEK